MKTTMVKVEKVLTKLVQDRINGKPSPVAIIKGPPGVGKSDIIRTVAKKLNIEVRDIRLAQMDPVDLRGVPFVEACETKWAVPGFFPKDNQSAGIIFFDELTSADPSIQVAAYQLILDRRCGDYEIPPKWTVVAAGNRQEDNAVVMPMSSALANRMMHLTVDPDPVSWVNWAMQNGVHPDVVSFIKFNPTMLFQLDQQNCEEGWPSPRSWDGVSQLLNNGFEGDLLPECVCGLVGKVAGAQFIAFRRQNKALGDIRASMLSEKPFTLPAKNELIYTVAISLAYYLWRGKDAEETTKLMDGFFRISAKLSATYAAVAMSAAISSKDGEAHAEQLLAHPEYQNWAERCSAELEKLEKGAN